jgi:4-hydroxy-tetrahydrodipicolinate reductase
MPTRVVVCYTGGVGSKVIRLIAADPDLLLVGALVHHADKEGRDAGELAGISPLGVAATRDVGALVALGADCMLFHGLVWEPGPVARFLTAGTNVYSSMGGWYLPVEPDHDTLARACEAGGSTHVSGGNIPGLISDVFPLFVSGYSARVTMVRARQSDHVPNYPSSDQLTLGLGIGQPPDPDAPGLKVVDEQWLWGIRQSAALVAAGLGVTLTEVRQTDKQLATTPADMTLAPSGLEVPAGTTAGVRWTWTAFSGDIPFFELVNEQTVRLGLGPGWRESLDEPNWQLSITGTPSLTATIDLPHGEEGTDAVSALNAARAVNFIPRLLEAPPGLRTVLDLPAPRASAVLRAPR